MKKNDNSYIYACMTSSIICKEYLGAFSPISYLDSIEGEDTFKLPTPIPYYGLEFLKKLCGRNIYSKTLKTLVSVPRGYKNKNKNKKIKFVSLLMGWLREIDRYLDVPILLVFSKYNWDTDKFWEELIKSTGGLEFIKRFKWNFKQKHINMACINGQLDIAKYINSKSKMDLLDIS